jgi:HAMP domain-containing protein
MPRGNPDIARHAVDGGKAKARNRLTLDKVEAAFGSLKTVEDAQRRLERLGTWAAAGMMAGSVAGAAVRSVEVWLKAQESKLTREVVEDLKGELDRLKAELKGRPVRLAP